MTLYKVQMPLAIHQQLESKPELVFFDQDKAINSLKTVFCDNAFDFNITNDGTTIRFLNNSGWEIASIFSVQH